MRRSGSVICQVFLEAHLIPKLQSGIMAGNIQFVQEILSTIYESRGMDVAVQRNIAQVSPVFCRRTLIVDPTFRNSTASLEYPTISHV